jgi:hypothetical protein
VKRLKNKISIVEVVTDIGAVLKKVDLVLADHEERLKLIEEVDLKIELELLHTRIQAVADPKKQAALQAFKNLCASLGISDLEFVQI